jgi:hypothetical protein
MHQRSLRGEGVLLFQLTMPELARTGQASAHGRFRDRGIMRPSVLQRELRTRAKGTGTMPQ